MAPNYLKNNECPENCGRCCANMLPLSTQEINTIKSYITTNHITPKDYSNLLTGYQDICPFLNDQKRCSIYEVRPQICDYYTCGPQTKNFITSLDCTDKHIIDLTNTFCKNKSSVTDRPNITQLDKIFRDKVHKAFGYKLNNKNENNKNEKESK